MNFSLVQGSASVVMNGAGALAPLRAGTLDLGTPGRAVAELALDGTAAQIGAYVQSLEKILYLAERYIGAPGEEWGYISVTLPDATVWRAFVRSGRCESVRPGARAGGSMGLKVALELEPYWESLTLNDLPLSNRYGVNQTAGISVYNHYDTGHDNWVNVGAGVVLGDVPAPAILTYTHPTGGLDCLFSQIVSPSALFNPILEGEAATAGAGLGLAVTADAACSSGNYGAGTWAGTGAVSQTWAVDAANAGYFGGRMYRPAVRLRDLVGVGDRVWANWWVGYSGTSVNVLETMDGILLPTDSRVVVFPPMALPPWSKPPAGFSWEPFLLGLTVQSEFAGAHALAIDFVQLMACDGWQRYCPIAPAMAATSIRHDLGTGQISRASSAMASHAPEGPGLWIYPGVNSRILTLNHAAPLADIGTFGTRAVQYRQRKRAL